MSERWPRRAFNTSDGSEDARLWIAAREGDLKGAQAAIGNGASPRCYASDFVGWTPLHVASQIGMLDMAKFLVATGAETNDKDQDGETPLNYAARFGRVKVVRLLCSSGADVTSLNKYGDTPLHEAAACGEVEVVRLLCSSGADVTSLNKIGKTPLDVALRAREDDRFNFVLREDYDNTVKLLRELAASMEKLEKEQLPPPLSTGEGTSSSAHDSVSGSLAHSAEAKLAYKEQMEGTVTVCRMRLFVVGPDRAGKTSLKNSLLGLRFDPKEPSTVGVAQVESVLVDVENPELWEKWEDDGQNSRVKQELAANIAEELKKKEHSTKNIVAPKTGLKQDKPSRVPNQVEVENAKPERQGRSEDKNNEASQEDEHGRTLQRIKLPGYDGISPLVIEFLKKETDNHPRKKKEFDVKIWDVAGQQLYYCTNSALLTDNGTYLLVIDATKELDDVARPTVKRDRDGEEMPLPNPNKMTNYHTLQSWLETIHNISEVSDWEKDGNGKKGTQTGQTETDKPLSPPVFIIVTHADEVSKEQMEKIAHTVTSRLKGTPYEDHVVDKVVFPVDNKTRSGDYLNNLRSAIGKFFKQETIPANWFRFIEAIRIYAEKRKIVTVEEAEQIAKDVCKIENVTEMLKYYADAGIINRCGEIIVLDTLWFTGLSNELISFTPDEEKEAAWQKKLRNTGRIDSKVLKSLFEKKLTTEEGKKPTEETITEVIKIFEVYGLIVPFKPEEEVDTVYLVPSAVTKECDDITDLTRRAEEQDSSPLYVNFCGGIMMSGVFPRLVVRLTPWLSAFGKINPLMLYDSYVKLSVESEDGKDQYVLHIYGCRRFIKVILINDSQWISEEEKKRRRLLTGAIRNFLETILELMREEFHWLKQMKYTFCVADRDSTSKCSAHGKERCTDDECIQLLPVGKGVGARFFSQGNWSQENEDKRGIPAPVDVMRIAFSAESELEALSKVLGFSESQLREFRTKGKSNRRSLFLMLMKWRDQTLSNNHTYPELGMALMDCTVQRGELASEYCTKEEYVCESREVGPEGDTLNYHGVIVQVPRGALEEEHTLEMSVLKTGPPPKDGMCVTPVIHFKCLTETLKIPVQIYLPFIGSPKDATGQSQMKLMRTDHTGTWCVAEENWRKEPSGLRFETWEFSNFAGTGEGIEKAKLACYLYGQASNDPNLGINILFCHNEETEKLKSIEMYHNHPIKALTGNGILNVKRNDDVKVSTVLEDGEVKVKPSNQKFKANKFRMVRGSNLLQEFRVVGELGSVTANTILKFEICSASKDSTGNATLTDNTTLTADLYRATESFRYRKLEKKLDVSTEKNVELVKKNKKLKGKLDKTKELLKEKDAQLREKDDQLKEKDDQINVLTDELKKHRESQPGTSAEHDFHPAHPGTVPSASQLTPGEKRKRNSVGNESSPQQKSRKVDAEEASGNRPSTDYVNNPDAVPASLLFQLSRRLVDNWRKVALDLNFEHYEVRCIETDTSTPNEQQKAFEMLTEWKDSAGKGRGATKGVLRSALMQADLTQLADDLKL